MKEKKGSQVVQVFIEGVDPVDLPNEVDIEYCGVSANFDQILNEFMVSYGLCCDSSGFDFVRGRRLLSLRKGSYEE